ncbi:MAG: hypothetical protein H7288_13065 [Kineosporiaceae bacterium]|nr:hypothetical protein [Aeromicrobium sp.]
MKIDAAIRDAHKEQEATAKALQKEVTRDLLKRKDDSWHYQSRVKNLESFALKVETGRIESLDRVEDIFGATLVVPDAGQIQDAIDVVVAEYPLHARRPPSPTKTSNAPDRFLFDDVRLYVTYQRAAGERTVIPDGMLFEVQVKTFLQHAWGIATHDVIYKTPSRDWRRERIASQIRATLEQAEVVIGGIGTLATTSVLPESDPQIEELNAIITILQGEWVKSDLPSNVRSLAESIQNLLWVVERHKTADRPAILSKLLADGKARNSGAHSLDWSPYRSVLNYVTNDHPGKLKGRIKDTRAHSNLLVYPEVLAALSVAEADAIAAVVAGP